MMFYNRGMRNVIIIAVTVTMLLLCVLRLFSLQIVNGESYRKTSEDKLYLSTKISAPRGNILDRYGNILVTNRTGYSLKVTKKDLKNKEIYSYVYKLLKFINSDITISDSLPITASKPYDFKFSGDDKTVGKNKRQWLKNNGFKENLTAEQVLDELAKKYKVENDYNEKYERAMLGIIYDMEQRGFSVYNPYLLSSDVSAEVIAKVKENNSKFPCIEVVEEPVRSYPNGTLAAHILGNVGVIYAEEYEKLKKENYGMDAIIGKQGAELAFEKYLKGDDGAKGAEQTTDGLGKEEVTKKVKHGNNVFLTIDIELQKVMEQSLKETIESIASGAAPDCKAGSAVCVDVNNGDILAMTSYPGYTPSEYNIKYDELLKDEANPIWNRAIGGAYEPGSTFKMVTAIAALGEGVVKATDTIYDKGIYDYYSDYKPQCMEYRYGISHGYVDVVKALQESCNYYFYDVGRRLTIQKLDKYAEKFGFGQYANIEIAGEVTGQIASPENKNKRGEIWNPGDTLQAAIGQSDTLITPLQLANYVATIANGGTRYQAHLLKSVKDYDTGNVIKTVDPIVVDTVKINPDDLKAVKQGMRKVAEEGTASITFKEFNIPIAGKTGTAEVPKGSSNGLFVAYAPADNPQIAIAIVIEHGFGGSRAAPVAKAVFEKYFEHGEISDKREINTLTR